MTPMNASNGIDPLRKSQPRRQADMVIAAGLCIVTFAVYWRAASFDFAYDDMGFIVNNVNITGGLTLASVRWAFTSSYMGNWQPLAWISHMLDVQFFGMSPGLHHLANVFHHAAAVLLLFILLRLLTGALWRSALVAALFAVHPLHVESVAWVTERKDALSAIFWILAAWAYLRYARRPGAGRFLPVVVFFVLGSMTKAMVVTLPFVLLLLDWWPLGRFGGRAAAKGARPPGATAPARLVLEKAPLFALAAVSCAVTVLTQSKAGALATLELYSVADRLANAVSSYGSYLGKLVWPVNLCAFYPHPGGFAARQIVWATLLLAGITVLAVGTARRRPFILVGWLFYLGTLVPVIGLVQVGAQGMADRYLYLPSIGVFVAVVWGLGQGAPRGSATIRLMQAAAALAVVFCLPLTWVQIGSWRDDETLFSHALAATTDNYLAHNNLAVALNARGDSQNAIAHFRETIRINPAFVDGYVNLANVLGAQGRSAEAEFFARVALRLAPLSASAHASLGNIFTQKGDLAGAEEHIREGLRLEPGSANALAYAGFLLAARGDSRGAEERYRAALRVNHRSTELRVNLGGLLAKRGATAEAIAIYREALRLRPDLAIAHMNLGNALSDLGAGEDALQSYAEALRLHPGDAEVFFNRGLALERMGRLPAAAADYKESLRLDSRHVKARLGLVRLTANAGR